MTLAPTQIMVPKILNRIGHLINQLENWKIQLIYETILQGTQEVLIANEDICITSSMKNQIEITKLTN